MAQEEACKVSPTMVGRIILRCLPLASLQTSNTRTSQVDGASFSGTPRYYRHALTTARVAAEHFQRDRVGLVVNLGDTIDGKCQDTHKLNGWDGLGKDGVKQQGAAISSNPGIDAIEEVVDALSAYSHGPILHTYGNHELYNMDREQLGPLLNIPFLKEPCGDLVGYWSHLAKECGVRFVFLDSYDVAVGGRRDTSEKRKQAEKILALNNPNFPENENSPQGLDGLMRRFVAFGGAVGDAQLKWLSATLEEAKQRSEKVILLSHQPIMPASSNPICLVWNYEEVLTLLNKYPCTVIASFSGHAHRGGYARCKESGIHFRVFEAVLESPDPTNTYSFVDVHQDCLVVRGLGDCESATYDFDHMRKDSASSLLKMT